MGDKAAGQGAVHELRTETTDPRIAMEILRAVNDLSYGSVEVVVHDGRVVQIERKEKIRLGVERREKKG